MGKRELFNIQDIRQFGFKYEPNESECIATKLYGIHALSNKSKIAEKIWCKYVNSVFALNGMIYVKGHTSIDLL